MRQIFYRASVLFVLGASTASCTSPCSQGAALGIAYAASTGHDVLRGAAIGCRIGTIADRLNGNNPYQRYPGIYYPTHK